MEKTVEVSHVTKSFNRQSIVKDISFDIAPGEIFGLIGPNGAGKTTIIRMLLDIIKPDSGNIRIMEGGQREENKDIIGYLPEERGLYRRLTVMDSLLYLGALKNFVELQNSGKYSCYFFIADYIEQIIGDLKCNAGIEAETSERLKLRLCSL